MKISGSCLCGVVRFAVEAPYPYPYLLCYCSICRKVAGGGGYTINLGALTESLEVDGEEHLSVYHLGGSETNNEARDIAGRRFCSKCGTHLWNYDPRWPELVHPFASVIDTDLPVPPERTHMMLAFKANWVPLAVGPNDKTFDEYPDESLATWHARLGLAES